MTKALIVLFDGHEKNTRFLSRAFFDFARFFLHMFDQRYFLLNAWHDELKDTDSKIIKTSYSDIYSTLTRTMNEVTEDVVLITTVETLIHDPSIVKDTLKDIETYQVVGIPEVVNYKKRFAPFFFAARTKLLADIAKEYTFAEYGNFSPFALVTRELLSQPLRYKELAYPHSVCEIDNRLKVHSEMVENQLFYHIADMDIASDMLNDYDHQDSAYHALKELTTFKERMTALMWHFALHIRANDNTEWRYTDILSDHHVPVSTWLKYYREFVRVFPFAASPLRVTSASVG